MSATRTVPRRTQPERRAATRTALLEATLAALVDTGYAGLTTADVATRAGVTRGAQAHYFATKGELVVEALDHLTAGLVAELVASPPRSSAAGEPAQYAALIDRVWDLLSGAPVVVLTELLVAARTDADLRRRLRRFDRAVHQTLHEAAVSVAPQLVARADFPALMATAIATVRGLWLLRGLGSESSVRRLWPAARDHLVAGITGPSAPAHEERQ